jgi:hypothetical protein
MMRVHEGVEVKPLPLAIPEPRTPPQPEYPEYAQPFPDQSGQGQVQPQQQRDRSQEDPVESLLRDLLGLY